MTSPWVAFNFSPTMEFLIKFETSAGQTKSLEITAPSLDAAIDQWDRLRQPGDFIESIGRPCRIQWPED
jgi:hypothetical protein